MADKEDITGFTCQQPERLQEFSSNSTIINAGVIAAAFPARQVSRLPFAKTTRTHTLALKCYSWSVLAIN